jgi:hypothetical protein
MPATRELLVEQINAVQDEIEFKRSKNEDVTVLLSQHRELVKKLQDTNELVKEGVING